MNRTTGKRALMVAWVLLLALASASGVLADLIAASGAWVEVGSGSASGGGISNTGGRSSSPSLALNGSGNPYVAWRDDTSGNYEIYIKRFNGTSWVEVGSGSASGGGISDNSGNSYSPSLALDDSGNPYVAWYDGTSGNYEIYIKRFNGTSWVEVGSGSASGGGISDNSGNSYSPSLALDDSGNPYVAWSDSGIYIKRFDGTSWVEVGSGSASGGGISDGSGGSPSLALHGSGNPCVAWADGTSGDWEIYIKRFNGANWVEVGSGSASGGGISNNSGDSWCPSLALDGSGNPYVAWYDGTSGDSQIYIKRFNGANWVEVGSGSASGGGISDNTRPSQDPSLALDTSGAPYVAWRNIHYCSGEIYIKRFNGTNWVEVASGSASRGGISGRHSTDPSLAVDGSGTPYVAWSARGASAREIYIKRKLWSNGSFEEDGRIPAPWKGKNLARKDGRVCNTAQHGSCSFRIIGNRANKSLSQEVNVSGSAGDSFSLSGWSKANNPSLRGGAYCLEARVFHTDGTKKTYRACFAKNTHDWQHRKKTFTVAKDYNNIVVSLLYYKQSGKAWFDHVQLLVRR